MKSIQYVFALVIILRLGDCALLGPDPIDVGEPTPQTIDLDGRLNATFTFYPPKIEGLIIGEVKHVVFTVLTESCDSGSSFSLLVHCEHPELATVPDESRLIRIIPDSINSTYTRNYTIPVKGVFLGRTRLLFSVGFDDTYATRQVALAGSRPMDNLTSVDNLISAGGWSELKLTYKVAVIRKERLIDVMFVIFVSVVTMFSKVGMGCKIDVDVVKEVIRRPLPLAIGFVCQFTVMPTVAFALSKAVGLEGGQALGFFASGCAPGGGASNMYTYLLHGDVSLSVTMTLISVTASLGMIPLWLLTLGQKILDGGQDGISEVEIPFLNILISLVAFLCPLGVGIFIQKKRPSFSKKIVRALRPFFMVFIVFMFSFGFYSNLYLFKLFTPQLVLAGMLLPYTGFVVGGFAATVFRQPKLRIVAIAIETGIQNTGIPLLMLKYSLPQPEADLSVIAPIIILMFTPIPLWFGIAAVEVKKRWCKKEQLGKDNSESEKEGIRKGEFESEETVFSQGTPEEKNKYKEANEIITAL